MSNSEIGAHQMNSPSVVPESTDDANGAQGANLTSEQQGRIDDAVIDDRDRADGYHCLGTGGLPTPTLHETVAAIVREHRAEVLAEIERRLAERQDVGNRTGDYNGGLAGAIAIVRDYRQEQNR